MLANVGLQLIFLLVLMWYAIMFSRSRCFAKVTISEHSFLSQEVPLNAVTRNHAHKCSPQISLGCCCTEVALSEHCFLSQEVPLNAVTRNYAQECSPHMSTNAVRESTRLTPDIHSKDEILDSGRARE